MEPHIAVNVSPIQLQQRDFVKLVQRAMEELRVKGCGLDLEITESLIMEDIESNIRKLKAIRDMGLHIVIDDFGTGYSVPTEEIIITSGALEGLDLCLQAVTRPGDLVAIESPSFYAALDAIERLGLKAVEIPTCPDQRVNLTALATALERHSIKACWLMTNFQNPLGSLMPDEKKQELVKLLALHDVPMIEDDVYSELYYGRDRPKRAKAFDLKGLVMHCSSFSKCLAPGYRVGWTAPGRFAAQVERVNLMTTIPTSAPLQAAIVEFLKHSGYKHHLRNLRQELQALQNQMLHAIGQ